MTNAANRAFATGAIAALAAACPDGKSYYRAAAKLARDNAKSNPDLGVLDALLSAKGQRSTEYARGVSAYLKELAATGRTDKALAAGCKAAGVLPTAEDRHGIVNSVFNGAERVVERVRQPRARQSTGTGRL